MIDKQQIAILKSNQDFNKNKQKISQYMKYSNDCFSVEISENYAGDARSIFTD